MLISPPPLSYSPTSFIFFSTFAFPLHFPPLLLFLFLQVCVLDFPSVILFSILSSPMQLVSKTRKWLMESMKALSPFYEPDCFVFIGLIRT
jgi:hypothetical protein